MLREKRRIREGLKKGTSVASLHRTIEIRFSIILYQPLQKRSEHRSLETALVWVS